MPTIWVGPVRSHCVPIRTSPFAGSAAFAAIPKRLAAPMASPNIVCVKFFISVPPFLSSALVRKWPNTKVITDVAPQTVQPLRLDDQEKDDEGAEHDQPQVRNEVQEIRLREKQPAEILEEPARHDRQHRHENGTEDR